MSDTASDAAPFEPALTVFMLVKASRAWLDLTAEARGAALGEHVLPLLQRHRADVRIRTFDVECYAARVTDVWVWEAREHAAYRAVVEQLRATPFWDGYFEILEILPGVASRGAPAVPLPAAA
jgi:hypothetical protein